MLAKKFRLPIKEINKNAEKIFSSDYFSIKSSPNNKTHNRIVIVIPNKAIPKSTRRHFWKRYFIEALRRWPDLSRDFLVIVFKKIENVNKEFLNKEINSALNKIKTRS
jgi:RNase P protein component